jgi:hypothetical protein
LVAASKGALKAATSSAGHAIIDEAKTQASVFASGSPSAGAAATAITNGAQGLLTDALGKAAAAQEALEGAVDDVGVACIR